MIKQKTTLLMLLLMQVVTYSQNTIVKDSNCDNKNYFVSFNYGYQMSGIKDEDFVSSNYTPLFNLNIGKWISPYFAFQIGYKGFYFNYIEDNIKHHYNYLYAEAVTNFNNVVFPNRINKNWDLLLHSGAGYFYNNVYGKPNLCANIGIQNNYRLTSKFQANIDIAAIVGWDIYQGNTDILHGISLGITYLFIID